MADKEWLAKLKAGDTVVSKSNFYGSHLHKVARTTATQIVLENGGKYRKANGYAVGDTSWSPTFIAQPTDELLLEMRKTFLCNRLRQIEWEKLNVGTLADIYDKAKNGQHLKNEDE